MADRESLLEHFDHKKIRIPVYQRNYDWTIPNCRQLYSDLMDLHRTKKRNHFFGSVIYKIDQETDERVVIDGQQRITTVSIMLLALRDAALQGKIKFPETSEESPESVYDLLVNRNTGKPYLVPVGADKEAYDRLLKGKCDPATNIGANYQFFFEEISKSGKEMDAEELFRLIKHLQIMVIRLTEEDDAQAIFESINSTGLALSEGDRIRNLVLMNLPPQDQDRIYNDYWVEIQDSVDDTSSFFRDYLTMVTGSIPNKNRTYAAFRNYILQKKNEEPDYLEPLLREIVAYAKVYQKMTDPGTDRLISKESSLSMAHMNFIGARVAYPFIMRIVRAYELGEKGFSKEDVEFMLRFIEDYVVRRLVCNISSNALNNIFATTFRTVSSMKGDASFRDKLVYFIRSKTLSGRFPGDEEVKAALGAAELYDRRVACSIVLSTLENANRDSVDTLSRIEQEQLTVEHVMPQTLSDQWRKELGPDAEEIHKRWCNRLGNLTLTAYNSDMSNSSFENKQNLKDIGFKQSGLWLNRYIAEAPAWTEKQIEERHEMLLSRFVKVLPDYNTDFVPPAPVLEECIGLDADWDDYRDKAKIAGYVVEGTSVPCSSAGNTLAAFAEEMYSRKPAAVDALLRDKSPGSIGNMVSERHDDDSLYRELPNGLYIYIARNNERKLKYMVQLAEAAGVDPDSVRVIIKKKDSGED